MTQTQRLQGKVVWLTGASSGIGLAVLKTLLEQGATVLATARRLESLSELSQAYPDTLHCLPADLSSENDLAALPGKLAACSDHLDYLILNAGVCEYVDVDDMELAMFRRVMELNYFAAIACCQIALPLLKAAPVKAQIVGVSSLSTVLPFTRAQAYGASKAAFSYFLEALRVDVSPAVDVSVVYPGFVATPLTDKNDFAMPFLQDTDTAARHILKVMHKRPMTYRFPKLFASLLSLFSVMPAFWLWLSANYLRKPEASR